MKKLTYKDSGVDIKKASEFKKNIKALVRSSFNSGVLKDIGGFGSFFALDSKKYKEPVLVSSTDGVGTKLKIALLANKHDSVGIDLVGMNVNDILCTGAEPLFFLDYIASAKLKPNVLLQVVKGINIGCIQSGCALVGGETAEMPGMYKPGEYDLAGFCVGAVDKSKAIDGKDIEVGNLVIGLESNGIHSNGYSLVRKVFSEKEQVRMSKELLRPTRIYVKPVLDLIKALGSGEKGAIKGIAHITGGAFYDKIARILPDNMNVRIKKNSWPVQKIFQLMQNKGNIDDKEMFHTFNMGIGMVLMVPAGNAAKVIENLANSGLRSWVIGEVIKGRKEVEIV
ncbi:MAG: phosphoribosylformylglycinamidine cyclo-ligase [Candidatus Omnitrophica bacterium]|nr:phosphoribosylformylglycinamidine cyclo-ligase [Candidatus Omnitrophota bacterium]